MSFSSVFEGQSALRIGLKCALLICFCVALVNAIIQVLARETTISIGYERETPLPAMTICPYPHEPVNVTNLTLVDFMKANLSLTGYNTYATYSKMYNDSRSAKPSPKLTFLQPIQSVTVINGTLTTCMTFEPPKKFLDANIAFVISVNFFYPVDNKFYSCRHFRWDTLSLTWMKRT